MRERSGGELLIELRGRERAGIEVAHRRRIEPALGVRILHRRVRGDLAIGEARGMAQQILHRHLAIGRHRAVGDTREFGIGLGGTDALTLEGWNELRDWIRELRLAVLHQDHHADRDQGLGHRVDAEHEISAIGLPASLSWNPVALACTSLPLRATRTTAPGRRFSSASFLNTS